MDPVSQSLVSQLNCADGLWAYCLVFLLAAAPMIKIFIVIPVAIGAGLDPFSTAISAFLGNIVPLYLGLLAYSKVTFFREKFSLDLDGPDVSSKLKKTVIIWDKYGVPGLSLISPGVTGTHVAAFTALGFGAQAVRVGIWMFLSLLIWTIILTIISCYGWKLIL
ncbi:conserved hypothetical protein [Methanosalsum zhilinae DSM 4017]|uniref:Small multi-drug export n=1 Tax=Methanosalsum zhilinae (strain DSM 4017 / NBRC 107636 / OCM 62 / WeN5) TaxID=679901 RepID=F7XL80_METZD|nr:small multi-drug export protein [Methanosalsum zhilinae]AEH60737.1 conserved hypothetical protein [Methanosalsum zhilinae DSM 4017]